jgi:hypothetical protein
MVAPQWPEGSTKPRRWSQTRWCQIAQSPSVALISAKTANQARSYAADRMRIVNSGSERKHLPAA